jgi:hypothetical protein
VKIVTWLLAPMTAERVVDETRRYRKLVLHMSELSPLRRLVVMGCLLPHQRGTGVILRLTRGGSGARASSTVRAPIG